MFENDSLLTILKMEILAVLLFKLSLICFCSSSTTSDDILNNTYVTSRNQPSTSEIVIGFPNDSSYFLMVPDVSIKPALPASYPFVAAVLLDNYNYICSAALISPGNFLTALTCVNQRVKYVQINSALGIKNDDAITVTITKAILFRSKGIIENSLVAILQTTPFNETIRLHPIRLAEDKRWMDKDCTAIGFGIGLKDHNKKNMESVVLRNLKRVPVIGKNMVCFIDLGTPVVSDDKLIGVVTSGMDGCISDLTKGPLVQVGLAVNFFHWVKEILEQDSNNTTEIEINSLRLLRSAEYNDNKISQSPGSDDELNVKLIILASLALLISYL